MPYFTHPKRGYTGYDPGRPDHVAALVVLKAGRKWCAVFKGPAGQEYSGGMVVACSPIKRKVEQALVRAAANAVECQQDRAAAHAARLSAVAEYLHARKARQGGQQLSMF